MSWATIRFEVSHGVDPYMSQVPKVTLCVKIQPVSQSALDKARYGAEYRFFELLVNMVNAENVVNVVNIIKAQEEEMICVSDI